MLDGFVGLFSVLDSGQNCFPFDHELFEIIHAELDVKDMFHIVNRSVSLAHPEVLVNHVEQLSASPAVTIRLNGLQLLELYLSRKIS